MSYRRWAIWIGLGSLSFASAQAQSQSPINALPPSQAPEPTPLRIHYFVDTTDHLSIDQINRSPIRWQTADSPTVVLGFLTHPVWYRFSLQAPTQTARSLALELTNFYVDSLTLYQPRDRGGWQMQHSGNLIPFVQRHPQTRYPSFYISLAGTDSQTFYARIRSARHQNYQWRLWDKNTFDTVRLPDRERYSTLAILGLLMLFALALLLFMYPSAVLRSYALWGLAFDVSALFGAGYSNLYFPNAPYWAVVTQYVSFGLLLPGLAYYVVQACRLASYWPRLVGVYIGFGSAGLAYAGLSFFYRHAYLTWALVDLFTIMLGLTFVLLVSLYLTGRRPLIWNVVVLMVLLPIDIYFWGRNAGFFSGSIAEESLKYRTMLSTIAEPFLFVMLLWQTTRDRIRTAQSLHREQLQRTNLQALDKLKTDFFTNVSHELRTPLTLLLGPVRTLLAGDQPPHKQAELLTLAHRSGQQLDQLVNDILDLGKLDLGKMQLDVQPTPLASFFCHQLAQFESLAYIRQLHLAVNSSLTDQPLAQLDQAKCRQILNNLLANAFKFTPPGGHVRVDLTLTADKLYLAVADTGTGIHPDDLPHLFERYFQTSRPDKPTQGGSGIGLALCQEYVQLMGGSIHVESSIGTGSVFRVVLPLVLLPPTDSSAPGQPRVADASTTTDEALTMPAPLSTGHQPPGTLSDDRPRLLVVEDNPDLQAYVGLLLGGHYTLITAHNGQQALERLATYGTGPSGIGLVLTDLMMPIMDGQQLLEHLKAQDATRHLPVIMLTARADSRDRLRALRVGVDDYLLKPFDEAELLARIDNLLTNQKVRQQSLLAELADATQLPAATDREAPSAPSGPVLSQTEQAWLEAFEHYVRQQLTDPNLSVSNLAYQFAMSESTLLRQLKRLTGLSPLRYVQAVRLEEARRLLESGQGYSVTQVAALVGYADAHSFRRNFRSRFGSLPSTLLSN